MQKTKLLLFKSRLKSKPLTFAGLIFGFIGAVLLAFSVEVINPAAGLGIVKIFGKDLTITTINQGYFWWGVILLAAGLMSQAIGIILEK